MAESKANITLKEQRLLHTKSGNRCAMCKIVLVDAKPDSSACIGENAHIYGEKPGSARYNDSLSKQYVNSEANLIFLCSNCHTKIDREPDRYSAEYLRELKKKHEAWVVEQLQVSSVSYGIPELEVLVKYILKKQPAISNILSTDLIRIEEKISKNELQSQQLFINMGLCNINTIEDFLNRYPDQSIASELTATIKNEYIKQKNTSLTSDEIFEQLWSFISGRRTDFNYKAAALGILVYFFEKCEVFEK